MQFHKDNIEEDWWDLVNEFPEFILDPSPEVEEWYNDSLLSDGQSMPTDKSQLCNLRYGFECDIGWKEIIREYFKEIQKLLEKARLNGDEVFYKTCIFKEKFGELRDQGDFYGKNYKEYWDDYLVLDKLLVEKSSKTCEICGKEGTLKRRSGGFGWLKTLCDEHAKTHNYLN